MLIPGHRQMAEFPRARLSPDEALERFAYFLDPLQMSFSWPWTPQLSLAQRVVLLLTQGLNSMRDIARMPEWLQEEYLAFA